MSSTTFWKSFWLTGLVGVGLVMVDWLWWPGDLWTGLTLPDKTVRFFCENTMLDNLLRQPSNSLSNLGFLWMGIWMWWSGWKDSRSNSIRVFPPVFSFLYAGVATFLFVSSTLFHASLTREAEALDLSAVYGFCLIPVALFLARLRPKWPPVTILLLWSLLWIGCNFYLWELPVRISIPFLISTTLILAILSKAHLSPHRKWLLVSGLCIGLGILCFAADIYRVGCVPKGWFHPHGAWHMLAAGSAGAMFHFLRSSH